MHGRGILQTALIADILGICIHDLPGGLCVGHMVTCLMSMKWRTAAQSIDIREIPRTPAIFADKGANLVRLRLWHNPDWTEYGTFADVTRSIRRARQHEMAVLLDFHYSDDWADPGNQIIPSAWRDAETTEELA